MDRLDLLKTQLFIELRKPKVCQNTFFYLPATSPSNIKIGKKLSDPSRAASSAGLSWRRSPWRYHRTDTHFLFPWRLPLVSPLFCFPREPCLRLALKNKEHEVRCIRNWKLVNSVVIFQHAYIKCKSDQMIQFQYSIHTSPINCLNFVMP